MSQFCEDLEGIDIVTNASIRFLMDHYISHGLPVIVNGGAMDWPLLQLDDLIQVLTILNMLYTKECRFISRNWLGWVKRPIETMIPAGAFAVL